MAIHSKIMDVLPEDYGLVLLSATGTIFVNLWMGINVSRARKRLDVKYPIMYSQENGGDNEFNCVQRAHQNTLEGYPTFMYLLLTSGLQYPRISAATGMVYCVGRVMYARGYYSGEPKARGPGGLLSHLCELVLLGGNVSLLTHLMGCFK